MTFISRSCISVLAVLCAVPSAAAADVPKPAAPAEVSNTTITAQRMTVRNQENKAVFEGGVVLTRPGLEVRSDTMVVLFKPVTPPASAAASSAPSPSPNGKRPGGLPTMGNRAISVVEASGRVRIVKDDGQATCGKAVYHGDEETIVLTESPVAWQKGTRVSGSKITMYLAEDRSVVEGGSRVMIEQDTLKK